MSRTKVAILVSGTIRTDLMVKILRASFEVAALVSVDPESEGRECAVRRRGDDGRWNRGAAAAAGLA